MSFPAATDGAAMASDKMNSDIDERLEAMNHAQFAELCRLETVSINGNEAVVRMPAEGVRNAMGNVHGGAIFTLADQAFALAANSCGDPQVGIQSSISYIKAAKGDLTAKASKVGETRNTSIYEVKVFDGETLVALFTGTGYRLKR